MKKVGVVIPIYNVEKYLKECLDSVINQTYTNLEIILVNDGSTDENSLNIAKEYTLKDKRITLFDKKNGGLSSARNVGIEYFSGEYKLKNKTQTIKENSLIEFNIDGNNPYEIYTVYKSYKAFKNEQDLTNFTYPIIDYIIFLDSDDYWELNCIEECVPRMDGVDVVWFDSQMFIDETKQYLLWSRLNSYKFPKNKVIITPKEWLLQSQLTRQSYFCFAWQGMINFNFLKNIKLKFINGILFEDIPFGIILFSSARYILIFNRKLHYYRKRNGSIMTSLQIGKPPFYMIHLLQYFKTGLDVKKYHISLSRIRICKELVIFISFFRDQELSKLIMEVFLGLLQRMSFEIFNINKDPLNQCKDIPIILQYSKSIYYDNNFKKDDIFFWARQAIAFKTKDITNEMEKLSFQTKYGTAKTRIQNQLSYKLGQAMIVNSKSILGYLIMPIVLLSIIISHKQEQKIYQEKIKKDPSLKLPPLEDYPDYQEALKEKECLTYKLGEALIKANKTWYKGGYVKLWFEIGNLKREFCKNK
ncbi:glycosyltransferase family 2 protein [Campylobacter lari]|nr:glycosyltransferase family 2 protein [Campylobacter lari]EDP6859255.1 glycosyltransferase [Campylobacter lari]